MRITIVGAGNIGTQFSVHCASDGNEVIIFTSNPEVICNHLVIVDDYGQTTLEGDIKFATNDPEEAFRDTDLIFVTYPANLIQHIAEVIYMHSSEKTAICVVPGNGGSECAFSKCIKRGNLFFLMQRVPSVARLVET